MNQKYATTGIRREPRPQKRNRMRGLFIFSVVTLLAIAVLSFNVIGADLRGEQATEGVNQGALSAPLVPVVQGNNLLLVDAVVVPVQHAALSMPTSGIVAEILAEEGALVEAGAVILRLKNAQQRAAVSQARAQLLRAQAHLQELDAGARPQELASAQAEVEAAQARLSSTAEGARSEEVAAARAAVQAAEVELQQLYGGPDQNIRIAAEAELANAEALLRQAQAAYDRVAQQSDIGMRPESLQLQEATNSYNAAKARYDALFAEPNADAVANARAKVQQAQADLNKVLAPASQHAIAEAEAELRRAQAQVDLLSVGAREEARLAAAAEVEEAQANLFKAEADLADTELRAPFRGTLAELTVKIGEQVSTGGPIVHLANLTAWQMETLDLTEIGVVQVHEGDKVQITFDALANLKLTGTVTRIKAIGENKQGDITYTAVIQPDEQSDLLRWNMTAVVTIR